MRNPLPSLSCVAMAVLSLPVVAGATIGVSETVLFNNLGTFQAPSLNFTSVVISGSAPVYALNLNGIGILGGRADLQIDTSEFMIFHFTQPAVNVSFIYHNAGNYDRNGTVGSHFLLGYDASGTFLGSVSHNALPDGGPLMDVSSFFGNAPLSEFRIMADVDGISIRSIHFTPVPEPGTLTLAGVAVLAGAGLWWRRRREGIRRQSAP